MTIIDAHQHFWRVEAAWHEWPQADLPMIHRDFLPGNLLPSLDEAGVAGTILVQSQPSDADTDWMIELAGRTPHVLGVVGWVDLLAPDAPSRIAALAGRPKLKGLRPMLQDLPDGSVTQPRAAPALAEMVAHGLVFDALIKPRHIRQIDEIAGRYADLRIVVDHAAKPDVAGRGWQPWADDLARLAARPNVVCKLSGLLTETEPGSTSDVLARYAQHVLARFGSDRVLWGSDWPVVLLRAPYGDWLEEARHLVPEAHREAVFRGNAARVYGVGKSDR